MMTVDQNNTFATVSASSKFRTVLKVKKIQERKAQSELYQLELVHAREEATLTEIKETQKTALTDAVRNMKIKATEAQTSRAFIKQLSREIDEQKQKVAQVRAEKFEKREELVERSKSSNMIEKLDKKMQAEETKETERKEQRLIDVLAQRIRTEIS
ncbi:MAG: flagellar export protein FliJ [Ignavibacteriales bacterium]|nr:flagellar export protein FliJ [Ignavibacteriales bacterium]